MLSVTRILSNIIHPSQIGEESGSRCHLSHALWYLDPEGASQVQEILSDEGPPCPLVTTDPRRMCT